MEINLLEDRALLTERFALPDEGEGGLKIVVTVPISDSLQTMQRAAQPLMLAALRRAISVLEQEGH